MQKKLIPFYNTPEGKKWFDHFVDTNVAISSVVLMCRPVSSLTTWKNCTEWRTAPAPPSTSSS